MGSVVYYSLLKRQNRNVLKELIGNDENNKIPDPKIAALISSNNLNAELAGLAYNIKKEIGQQLLLQEPILKSLTNRETENTQNLLDVHGDGFWAVLEQIVIDGKLFELPPTSLTNLCTCIEEIGLFTTGRGESKVITKAITSATQSLKNFSPFDTGISKGIQASLKIANDKNYSKSVLQKLNKSIKDEFINEVKTNPEVIISELYAINSLVKDIGHGDSIPGPYNVAIFPDDWINEYAQIIGRKDEPNWIWFEPISKGKDITQSFINIINQGQFFDPISIKVTSNIVTENIEWIDVTTAMYHRMQWTNSINNQEVAAILQALFILRHILNSNSQNTIDSLISQGNISHWYYNMISVKDIQGAMWCFYAYMNLYPLVNHQTPSTGNAEGGRQLMLQALQNSSNEQYVESLIKVLEEVNDLGFLLKMADTHNKYDPLINKCLNQIVYKDYFNKLFTTDELINRWREWIDVLDQKIEEIPSFDALIKRLIESEELTEKIINTNDYNHSDSQLYVRIFRHSNSFIFANWCIEGLNHMSEEEWLSEFENGVSTLHMITILLENDYLIELGTPYIDAHEKFAEKIRNNSYDFDEQEVKMWLNSFNAADKNLRPSIQRQLLDILVKSEPHQEDNLYFKLYGDEILLSKDLIRNKADITLKVFSPILKQDIYNGILWMSKIFDKHSDYIESVSVEIISESKDRLQRKLDSVSEEDAEIYFAVNNVAGKVGLEKTPQKSAESEEEKEGT